MSLTFSYLFSAYLGIALLGTRGKADQQPHDDFDAVVRCTLIVVFDLCITL